LFVGDWSLHSVDFGDDFVGHCQYVACDSGAFHCEFGCLCVPGAYASLFFGDGVYSASWPSWSQLVSPGSGPLFPATRIGLVRVTPIGWKSHSQGLSPAIARKSIGRALLLVDCG